ncbi:MAG: purine-nucleoside phosphorylase [Ignavibacteria bacterium]|nr:purine-nucleoside phosphorylase [Ignavibacteria bacterium]
MNYKIGIILGSGLGGFSKELLNCETIFTDIDSFHKMKIMTGRIFDKEIILFSGRRHYYEGYNSEKILEFVDFAYRNGVKLLIISNAAGGLNRNFKVSDLMLITSHLNFLKTRFPVSGNLLPYENKTSEILTDISLRKNINLRKGSYCCMPGPNYETKSEINFLSKFGIDAVGMSTVPEVMFASEKGIKVIAISCITNLLSVNSTGITDHTEVLEAGKSSYRNFSEMILSVIENSDLLISNEINAD